MFHLLLAFSFAHAAGDKQVSLLDPQVLDPGLAMIAAKNPAGAGEEASKALAWVAGRKEVFLENGRTLAVKGGPSLAISEPLGKALDRMNRYFGMTPATTANPVALDDLKAALLSPVGIKKVEGLFEEEIAQRIQAGGKELVPEIGGEVTLDSEIRFHEEKDPVRPVYRKIAAAAHDPKALGKLFEDYPEPMKLIDEHGLLKRLLESLPRWEARDSPPKAKRDEIMALTVQTILENSSDTYVFDPESQFSAIVSEDWGGRYVGPWHMHPPDMRPDGFHAHEENQPSGNDMEIAKERGQNLTIVFEPDGFDVYDLSPLAGEKEADLRRINSFTYRNPEWRAHFQDLRRNLPR